MKFASITEIIDFIKALTAFLNMLKELGIDMSGFKIGDLIAMMKQ